MSDTKGAVRSDLLHAALPGLEIELRKVQEKLNDLERSNFQHEVGDDPAFDRKVFSSRLQRARRLVSMCLEAGGLAGTRNELEAAWKGLSAEETEWIPEIDVLHSEPLSYLDDLVDGIRILVAGGKSPTEIADASRLKDILEATAVLVHQRGVDPKREQDVQRVMDDYLEACFLKDFVKRPRVPGFIKNFEADVGIRSLRTAIEYKFASTESELKVAASGIIEDTAGYKGGVEWVHFYSVIYTTEPFVAPARLRADLDRVGAVEWVPVVVNGGRKRARRAKAGGRKPKGSKVTG